MFTAEVGGLRIAFFALLLTYVYLSRFAPENIREAFDNAMTTQALTRPAYELVKSQYDLSSAERQIEAIFGRLGLLVSSSPHPGPLPEGEGV